MDLKNDPGVKKFIENAPVAMSFIDKNGIILYANKAELELFGYNEQDYVGHLFGSFYKPGSANAIEKILEHSYDVISEEVIIIRKDGSFRDILVSTHDHMEDGSVAYTMLISRDISKLKKVDKLYKFLNTASEELTKTHDSEEALNKILQFIVPDFADWFTIDLLTENGELELAKMTHSDPEKIEWAKKYRALNPIDMNDQQVGSMAWVFRTGQTSFFPVITDELILSTAKSKEEAEVLMNLSLRSAITVPIKNEHAVIGSVSFISTKKDQYYDQSDVEFAENFARRMGITLENSRLFENIRKDITNKIEANKQKDDFLAIASHELKTPLTSVKGYIHILSSLIKKGEEVASLNILKKTERQINKMTKLIHNFLDVSRLESSKLVIEKEEFDLNELVSETINYFNLPENKERLRFNPGKINTVKADRSKISQVIDNYLSNALKYSAVTELVIMSTFIEGDETIVSVKDSGIGINTSSKDKIFQRFYRAENMKNVIASGFGIGLYLSGEIIRLHNGRTWFDSEEGVGSTFYFSLPNF